MKIGHERRDRLGERYVPSQFQSMPSSQHNEKFKVQCFRFHIDFDLES